jgi:hypothetical protein
VASKNGIQPHFIKNWKGGRVCECERERERERKKKKQLFKDRIKPVLMILLRGTPTVHEISVFSHLQVLGQAHCIQHPTPGTLGNATRKS